MSGEWGGGRRENWPRKWKCFVLVHVCTCICVFILPLPPPPPFAPPPLPSFPPPPFLPPFLPFFLRSFLPSPPPPPPPPGDSRVQAGGRSLHPPASPHCRDKCPAQRGHLIGGHEDTTEGEDRQGNGLSVLDCHFTGSFARVLVLPVFFESPATHKSQYINNQCINALHSSLHVHSPATNRLALRLHCLPETASQKSLISRK